MFPVLLLLLYLFSACSENQKSIKIKGSDTEVNLAVELAEKFHIHKNDFSVSISGGGSGMGIASLYNGQADIANSSRPLSDDEKKMFQKAGIELKTIVFAEDATAIIVNPEISLTEIDVPTLAKIMSGELSNWEQLGEKRAPINIYGRQSNSGTHSFIQKKLKIHFSPKAKEMNGNAQIIEGIKADPTGIGYVGAGYLLHNTNHKVKVLKIKATATSTSFSPLDNEIIKAKKYYFQRPLYQFVTLKSWKKAKAFIDFERSAKGMEIISKSGYYIVE
ncbi:MAG: PstS family phosphate ABC transporter substrate-binding protein [Cloacibacterium sp.]|nr:PstS family phosphate ABC transporter substrate-binding protein [Cloacibacterium sp.]